MAKRKVNFILPSNIAQGAEAGVVLGDFNNWNQEAGVPLTKQKDGSLAATISLDAGATFQYRYLLNDGRWVNDDKADQYVHIMDYQIENCVVTVPKTVQRTTPKKETTAKKTAAPKKATTAKKAAPKATSVADDLTKIEGIGKKIAGLLIAEGIITFADLSKSTAAKIKKILAAAGPRYTMHNPTTWPKQAKLAAAGKFDELKVLQDELNGGK